MGPCATSRLPLPNALGTRAISRDAKGRYGCFLHAPATPPKKPVAKRLPSMATVGARRQPGRSENLYFVGFLGRRRPAATMLEPIRFPLALPNFGSKGRTGNLEHIGDERCGFCRTIDSYRAVSRRSAELLNHGGGDCLGARLGEVHAPTGAVAFQAISHVKVLLEMVSQGKIQEWPACRRQLHRCCQAALDERDVTGRQVPVQLRHVRVNFDALRRT